MKLSDTHTNRGRWIVPLLLLLGFALRLDLLLATDFRIDSDEAIVGLMAKHIIEGRGVPTFYYGQHYMGSLEALCAGLLFLIMGVTTVALKLVPFTFSLVFLALIYQLALELFDKYVARLALLFAAMPSSVLIIWSSKARGGFIEIMCLGALALLWTTRWIKADQPKLLATLMIGLLLGLGWWINNQVIYFMAPIGLVMLFRCLSERQALLSVAQHALVGCFSFLLGGLPYWLYNIKHDFASLQMFQSSEPVDLGEHISGLFSTALPIILGAKRDWHFDDVFPGSSILVALVYGFIFILFAGALIPVIWKMLRLKYEQQGVAQSLLLWLVISCLATFTLSSFGHLVQAPRYLLPLYVAVTIIPACVIVGIWRANRGIAAFLTIAILVINILSYTYGGRAVPGEPYVFKRERAAKSHAALINWLNERNYTLVKTNYWIGYRLALETKEAIRFIMFGEPHQVRIDAYEAESTHIDPDTIPLILTPKHARYVEKGFKLRGFNFKREELGKYVILHEVQRPERQLKQINPDTITVTAEPHPDTARLALDGDLSTRWASARHQEPGMLYQVTFDQPRNLRGIQYIYGHWSHDYPRGLLIKAKTAAGVELDLFNPADYEAMKYTSAVNEEISIYLAGEPVVSLSFIQTGSHPILDWSIAELKFFE